MTIKEKNAYIKYKLNLNRNGNGKYSEGDDEYKDSVISILRKMKDDGIEIDIIEFCMDFIVIMYMGLRFDIRYDILHVVPPSLVNDNYAKKIIHSNINNEINDALYDDYLRHHKGMSMLLTFILKKYMNNI